MGKPDLELVDAGPDGVCGAETVDGTPCQRPAGDDGTCWETSHQPGSEGHGPDLPHPPRHLGEIGQECWWHHVQRLEKYGVLERADTTVVEKAAEVYELGRLFQRDLRETGPRIQGRDGTEKKNPSLQYHSDCVSKYRKLAKQIDKWIGEGALEDDEDEDGGGWADW